MKGNNKKSPVKSNLEEIYKVAKKGISKENKDLLLDELDTMIQTLEDWKNNNPEIIEKRKAS